MHCYINIDMPDSPLPDKEYTSLFSILCTSIFYGMLGYSCKKLIDSYYSLNNKSNEILKEYSSDVIKSININHNDDYKQTLFYNLLL